MSREYFTPGPWTEDRLGRLVGSNGKQVDVWGLGCAHAPRNPESEANAQLMRSAPKLYKAAESAEEMLVSIIGVYGDNGACFVVEELREAMAEARGESE